MMRRKGDLLKNTLGILLTVLGLVVFIAGIAALYNLHSNQESENAKKTINVIMNKIDVLPEGQTTQAVLQGFPNARNWYLISWLESDITRPNKCFFSDCLCICPGATADACQKGGFCRSVDLPLTVDYYYVPYDYIDPELGPSASDVIGIKVTDGIDRDSVGSDIRSLYDEYPDLQFNPQYHKRAPCIRLSDNLFDIAIKRDRALEDSEFKGGYTLTGESFIISSAVECHPQSGAIRG